MKIRNLALVLIFLLAAAYAGATWHFSNKAADALEAWPQKIAQRAPMVSVVNSEYRKGFLSSTQTITLQGPAAPGAGAPQQVTLRNVIQHGPFPGFNSVGTARIEHELVFDPATAAELAKVFGGQPVLQATTLVDFVGGGTTDLKGAPATYRAGTESVAWQGFTGKVRFARDAAAYSIDLTAPGLAFTGKDGASGELKALTLKTDQTRMANTESVYLGKVAMGIASFAMNKDGKPVFELKDVAANSEVTSKATDLIDVTAAATAAEVRTPGFEATKAEYAFSFKHLHAPTLDRISKASQEMNEKLAAHKGSNPADVIAMQPGMMEMWTSNGIALLKYEPVIAIDRVGFVTKDGATTIAGNARVVGVTDADLKAPLGMLAKIQAEASLSIAEPVAAALFTESRAKALQAAGAPQMSPEALAEFVAQARQAFDAQLAGLVEAGYVIRDNGVLTSKIAFNGGQVTVNGKPFNGMPAKQ